MKSPYSKIVRWSNEDRCYIGTCPGLFYGGVHGKNEMKVYRDLCREVAFWENYEAKKQRHKKTRRHKKARYL